MAGSKFTVGSDTVMTFLNNGAPIGAMVLTNFNFKQKTSQLVSKPVNGDPNYREMPEGWEGTLEYDKANSALMDFFVAAEAARYAGNPPPSLSILHKVNNTDGSVSRYRFEGVAAKLDNGGDHKSDEKVMETVGWTGSRAKAA